MTTARRLLQDIDGLPFGARQGELADRARALVGTSELSRLLDDLQGQGSFGKQVALHMASVAGERDYVRRCLAAKETGVVRRALGIAVRLGVPADALVERLPELPTALRHTLYQAVRRRRATEVAEALLPRIRALFGDGEAAVVLPVCTAPTVAAALPELGYAVTGWRMIGHRHPEVLLGYLDAELAATPRVGWARLLDTTGSGIAAAAPSTPGRVLTLLEQLVAHAPLPGPLSSVMGALARHDAHRLLGVLLDPRRSGALPGGRKLWRAILGAEDRQLAELGGALHGPQLVRYLRALPPARRVGVYEAVVGDRDLVHSRVPLAALDELPAVPREAEARRLLALHSVAGEPQTRLEVTARLSWPDARETLWEATRASTADERAHAYPCLVRAAAASRDAGVFGELLGSLTRLRNEQDPVRAAALRAVAEVPPWLFRPTEADAVRRLMLDAAQARDCSWLTENAVRALAIRLIRQGTVSRQPELVDTGLDVMSASSDQWHWVNLSGLDRELPRGAEHHVFEALRSRLERDARRGRFQLVLSLATGLDRRAWTMPELQKLVGKARRATDDMIVRMAIEEWLRPPATRNQRLAEVFRSDRSTITLPAVQHGIGFRRTDLLDEVFTKSLHGRFLKRGVRYVPEFSGCMHRWLPRQCTAYAELLGTLAGSRKVSAWERAAAVRQLGRVPGAAEVVRRYVGDPEIAVAEAALAALAWTDEPADVLPELLEHADSDRARVAVYAASRSVRFMPPARLGEGLARALASRKVTSRKEAIRLLAAHHAPGAAATLAGVWTEPNKHRDVRRAVVWATRWFLDDEHAWSLLTDAAGGEHAVAVAVLDLEPHTIAERHRARYAALVRRVADAAEPDTAQLGLAAFAAWTRWDEEGAGMLVDRVTDLANTASWRPALHALVAGCAGTENAEPLTRSAARLIAKDGSVDGAGPAADRDLPARQRILALATEVRQDVRTTEAMRAAAAALAETLAGAPTLRRSAVELAVAAVPITESAAGWDAALPALLRLAQLADQPVWGWHAHRTLRDELVGLSGRLVRSHMRELATALAAHPATPSAHLLAVAIADVVGRAADWPLPWRELIANLRRHPDPDVSLAALDTFTSVE